MEDLGIQLVDSSSWLEMEEVAMGMEENAPFLDLVKYGEEQYSDSLGWLDVDEWAGDKWLATYQELAKEVQEKADVLVVIGIGGSNQAARAVVDAIGEASSVRIVWAGNNISADSICDVLKEIEGKSVYINVIAKNFETLEPGIGFRALRSFLKEVYGDSYAERVICTGTQESHLDELCKENGFRFLPFPDNIGGRFTALSPVGLFPMAVAGMNINAIAAGAKHMRQRLHTEKASENIALKYAVVRNQLYQKGFRMEMLSYFEPRYFRFAKWWMQLFGESEGKDNKGLYPLFGNFSEDLHSIGQFLQDGSNVIFETFLDVQESGASYVLHNDDVDDRFDYLNGKDFDEINRAAFEATLTAHSKKFPCVKLTVPTMDEESFGQLFYFFEFVCYLSAKILGVNPFDQPGVEAYKQYMFEALGKYE
ncbi:MAG: glucose-6-phosphate isomerase [Herbinix sp.]|jgi:glucose-6-phosphate isomerase|nr:glucose-6-phosphate isomerase [Herbinix sp.]